MLVLSWYDAALRLGAATLLGGLIGLERERTTGFPRAAGLRTLALVALGSCLMTLVSAYGFAAFTSDAYAKVNPTRIAAQVISGIGFLGAGAILLRRNVVRGLTTAAAVWVVAGLGLACGTGFYVPAVITTAIGLIVLEALRPLERLLFPTQIVYPVTLSLARDAPHAEVLASIYATLQRHDTALAGLDLRATPRGEDLELRCRARTSEYIYRALGELRAIPGVVSLRAELRGQSERAAREATSE